MGGDLDSDVGSWFFLFFLTWGSISHSLNLDLNPVTSPWSHVVAHVKVVCSIMPAMSWGKRGDYFLEMLRFLRACQLPVLCGALTKTLLSSPVMEALIHRGRLREAHMCRQEPCWNQSRTLNLYSLIPSVNLLQRIRNNLLNGLFKMHWKNIIKWIIYVDLTQTNEESVNGTVNGGKGIIYLIMVLAQSLFWGVRPPPTQLELEHIINNLKWYTSCNLKPAFWINYSPWKCRWWRTAPKLCTHTESEQSSLLFKRLYISESVSTSLPNQMPPPPQTWQSQHWTWLWILACFPGGSREQLTFKTQE